MLEDFEKILEESLEDPDNMRMLAEKAATEEDRRMSVGEIIKDYPKPQREIDLHGNTGREAMFELENFINRCVAHRVLTVRVITGKGLHSKNFKSVLPELTEKKLSELRRDGKVLTFRREKSAGAFAVYLIS